MKAAQQIEEVIRDRFGVAAPTLQANTGRSAISFSRLACDDFGNGLSKAAEPEDAYVLHLQLRATENYELYLGGRRVFLGRAPASALFLSSMENRPVANLQTPFDFFRMHIPRASIDDVAREVFGMGAMGLRLPDQGIADRLMLRMATSLLPLFREPSGIGRLFLDSMAIALLDYLLQAYGGEPVIVRKHKGGLAPWQERRAKELMDANLVTGLALAEIALQCDLSPGHFSKAFRITTGKPPHRWFLERRVELAKQALVQSAAPLADVARACGFSNASHLSRIFSQLAGEGPASWRRRNRPQANRRNEYPRSS